MSYPEMAEDVLRFVERRDLGPVTLIGHNAGAKIAMVTASLFPEAVRGLVCLDTAPTSTNQDTKQQTLDTLKKI